MESPARFVYITQLPGVIDQFALGIALALVMRHPGHGLRAWLQAGWRNFAAWTGLCLALFAAAASWDAHGDYLRNPWMVVAWRPMVGFGCAAALAVVVTFPLAAARVLAPARYLGQVSYGIYLWHMPVLLVAVKAIPQLQGWRLLGYVATGSVLLAAITWHLMEKPALQAARAWRRTPAPA